MMDDDHVRGLLGMQRVLLGQLDTYPPRLEPSEILARSAATSSAEYPPGDVILGS